jgi:hypothetical protein
VAPDDKNADAIDECKHQYLGKYGIAQAECRPDCLIEPCRRRFGNNFPVDECSCNGAEPPMDDKLGDYQ